MYNLTIDFKYCVKFQCEKENVGYVDDGWTDMERQIIVKNNIDVSCILSFWKRNGNTNNFLLY